MRSFTFCVLNQFSLSTSCGFTLKLTTCLFGTNIANRKRQNKLSKKVNKPNMLILRKQICSILRAYSSAPNARQAELMARSLPKKTNLPGVDKIIVVASGKGGVGKSTKAVNLAVTLATMGKKVGLLDADVFGPSIPLMMNIREEPLVNENNLMIPPVNYGVKCLSMGMLVDSGSIIWRGPLVMSALQRLLKGAIWGPLDILVVDTPPGTGDIHLSLAQNVPVSGVLLISTPQAAALEVTARGADMFKKLNIPILGIVENMQHAICSKCGNHVEIFKNITKEYSEKIGVQILENFPIENAIAQCCDDGIPMCIKFPDSMYAKSFHSLATKLLDILKN